jgi:hypothetical protein
MVASTIRSFLWSPQTSRWPAPVAGAGADLGEWTEPIATSAVSCPRADAPLATSAARQATVDLVVVAVGVQRYNGLAPKRDLERMGDASAPSLKSVA